MSERLTPKQAIFAEEYALHGNATQAARAAGCPEKSARTTGSRWLTNANICAAIDAAKARIARKYEVTAERTIGTLARIAYHDKREMFDEEGGVLPIHLMSEAARTSVAGFEIETSDGPGRVRTVTVRVKEADRVRALELLGKYQKLFTDKTEIGGMDGGPIEENITVTFVRPS